MLRIIWKINHKGHEDVFFVSFVSFIATPYTKSRHADILYAFRFCIDTTFDSRQTCINGTPFRVLIVSKW